MGLSSSDDAAVYKITDDIAFISTVDFFPPVSEDAYLFGQIAAANALSDIYAMGGEPKLVLNLLCVTNEMPDSVIKDILKGGADKVEESGAIICGGHSIYDDSPKYGLAVNGFVNPKKLLKNSTAKPGDFLILTKPIGSGIITTASKADLIEKKLLNRVYQTMAFLNAKAQSVMKKYEINACTDITGFGLLGHLYEMAKASSVSISINYSAIPIFDETLEYAEMGFLPAGVYSNKNFVGDAVHFYNTPRAYQDILFDPQTSGGLLISVPESEVENFYSELSDALTNTICGKPEIIGRVECLQNDILQVKE